LEVGVVSPGARPVWKLISGRLPDPSDPDQVLASFTLQQDEGVHLGTVIRVPFYAASQLAAANGATGAPPRPAGPTVAFHVVGIEAAVGEFPSGSAPVYDLFASRAFARTVVPRTANGYEYFVRLRGGAAGLARFDAEANALHTAGVEGYENGSEQVASVQASIRPQAIGWWILAALAAVVGLAVIGQAMARQGVVESGDYPTLAALGADRRQLVTLGMARSLAVALAGAAGAVALATALSPLAPVGEARLAETSTGVAFDLRVLPLGALAVVVAVLALSIGPAVRAARTVRSGDQAEVARPSAVVARLAAMGAPPSAVIGVRQALQRKHGGTTIPVGTALLGTVLAVMALCGTGVFGASLSHLLASPTLYGDPFQLNFSNAGGQPDPALLRSLVQDRAITRISHGIETESSVNGVTVGGVAATAIRGRLLFSAVAGQLPGGDGQIGLGGTTMRQVGAHLGSVVHVTVPSPSGGKRTAVFRVVAQVSFPVISGAVGLGTGTLVTIAGYEDAACPPGPRQAACQRAVQQTRQRRDPGQRRSRSQGAGGHRPLRNGGPDNRGTCHHPVVAHQLRRGGQLPAHLRRHAGRVRRGDAGSSARRERVAPPTGNRLAQGAGVRERPGCLDRGLAGHDDGPRRSCHRRPLGGRGWPGDVAGIRHQPRRHPGLRGAPLARGRAGGGHHRGREPAGHRTRAGGNTVPARTAAADAVTRRPAVVRCTRVRNVQDGSAGGCLPSPA
jgi:hypothetical protein